MSGANRATVEAWQRYRAAGRRLKIAETVLRRTNPGPRRLRAQVSVLRARIALVEAEQAWEMAKREAGGR